MKIGQLSLGQDLGRIWWFNRRPRTNNSSKVVGRGQEASSFVLETRNATETKYNKK